MHTINQFGYMSFLWGRDRFLPISLHDAPYEIKTCFHHSTTSGVAMLIFSSFDDSTEAVDRLIKHICNTTLPKNEREKTEVLSTILCAINTSLSTHSVIIAPNHILRKNNLVPKNNTTTIVSSIPEKDYLHIVFDFIRQELALLSFHKHFNNEFSQHHVTTLVNLLLSKYCKKLLEVKFDGPTGKWIIFQQANNTVDFINISKKSAFSIHRDNNEDYLLDKTGVAKISEFFTQELKEEIVLTLHSIFAQCFSSIKANCVVTISSSIVGAMPDWAINAIANVNVFELKRRSIYLCSRESYIASGDALFYEVLVLSMEFLHSFLVKASYLGELPAPQFAQYQMHYDKCFKHEINMYINIGRIISLSLYDRYAFCPEILSTNMIKALFIFTKEDLSIPDDVSYEKLKNTFNMTEDDLSSHYNFQINDMARKALKNLTKERRKKIATILFLLFPKILYEHSFAKGYINEREQSITEHVITSILLDQKDIFINNPEQITMVVKKLLDEYDFVTPHKVTSYIKKGKFNNNRLLDEILKECKSHVISVIEDIYVSFIEPIFVISWSTYLHSKMQYTSLGDRKNSSSNQLHAYISMVGKYDHYFDAINLGSLALFLKELKNEKHIFDVLGDPFDTKVISKLKETISGFYDYHALSDDRIDAMIITEVEIPIVIKKRDWIREYLKKASSEERKWFFRFSTNIPYVNPHEFLIHISGSKRFSESKIVYSNSCLNNLVVGLTYHVEYHDEEPHHYFFDNINDIKQIFPDVDVTKKAKEFFLQDLYEAIDGYRNFIQSRLPEVMTNTADESFKRIKKFKKSSLQSTNLSCKNNT